LSAIDDVLGLLEDGKWHDVGEAVKKYSLHESKVETILGFLAEYKFIILNKKRQKVKLTPRMLKFVKETQSFEKENTLSG